MTASLTSNPLLKYGALGVVAIAGFVVVNNLGSDKDNAQDQVAAENGHAKPIQINPSNTRLGDEADNTETSIESLAGTMAELRAKIARLESGDPGNNNSSAVRAQQQRDDEQRQQQIEALQREISDLRANMNNRPGDAGGVALPEPENNQSNNANQADLQATLDAQKGNQSQDFGLQDGETPAKTGFSLPDIPQLNIPGREVRKKNNTQSSAQVKSEMDGDTEWIQPADARMVYDEQSKKEVVTLPEFKGSEYSPPAKTSSNGVMTTGLPQDGEKKSTLVPVYTIPSGATLLNVTGATALIGRIPMNNAITSPYPFKIVVGAKNLATNGINIPNLKGMVLNGTATGDYTLQCVNGQINSVTYTFMDGTIRTVTSADANGGGGRGGNGGSGASAQQSATGSTGGLGYIADSQGVPCVTGKLITNIDEYLTQTMAINALAGAANAFAEGQASVTTNTDGSSNSVIAGGSSTMNYMAGKGLGAGVQSGADVLAARQQGAYDAVYVGPGASLEIHITQQLEIDYDKKGRKVSHVQSVSRYSSNRGLD